MDKNFIIGLVLILLMLIGYQILVPKPAEPTPVAQITNEVKSNSVANTVALDSAKTNSVITDSASAKQIVSKDIIFETQDVRVVFSNKGGVMKEVMLKKYKTYDQKPLYLIADKHNKFQIDFPTQTGDVRLTDLYFTTQSEGGTLSAKRFSSNYLPDGFKK
ncbi:hypothetical protein [Dyadobacter sp. NIV53]|uniref:hypothetical protein n=1 Tax=Dyadobacter sp. NIV53 TaxID=2861765 RepID=UPI00286E7906|nr:hypothetical protein [Dyadobacter sp. NIV53]